MDHGLHHGLEMDHGLHHGLEIELIFALREAVYDIVADFKKVPYLGMKLGHWQKKSHNLHIHPPSTPEGKVKLSLFLLYRLRFPRYGPIFTSAIFGRETWQVVRVHRSCRCTLFLQQGIEIELILALLRATVSQIKQL